MPQSILSRVQYAPQAPIERFLQLLLVTVATLAMGFDLSGDFRDGGVVMGGALGYRRMLGDAADAPFTSLRGDADQFTAILGVAYVF